MKIRTKIKVGSGCFWIWKEREFFWFWIEGSPDFFGVFCEGPQHWRGLQRPDGWFKEAAHADNPKRLREILRHQIHHGRWARAITLTDPREGKAGVWRVVWSQRDFLLQNTQTNRAVRFHPETHWPPKSPCWKEMNRLENGAEFFAQRFWPMFHDRRGRLTNAFEFLELPIEDQEHPLRFGRGNRTQFETLVRAALIACYDWPDGTNRTFGVRFYRRDRAPIFDFSAYRQTGKFRLWEAMFKSPLLMRLARWFEPFLVPGFSFQSVAPSPLALAGRDNERSVSVPVVGPFTHHELLEARLTMRDWCARNAPELSLD